MQPSALVDDVFLRQPFQRRPGGDGQMLALSGERTRAAVKFAGGRGGEQRMGARIESGIDPQSIAADHAAGGMKNRDVADLFSFGIERPLHL